MVILVNPVQPENAEDPIEVTLEGIEMLVSPEQDSNALGPIKVTLEGISMFVRLTGIVPLYL